MISKGQLKRIWLALYRKKVWWRFCKILWPSQNIWTLKNNFATSEWVWLIVHRFFHSAKNLDLAWKLARLANIKCSPTIQCCALTSRATSLVYTATKLRFSGAEMITGYLQLLNMDLDDRAYNWNLNISMSSYPRKMKLHKYLPIIV